MYTEINHYQSETQINLLAISVYSVIFSLNLDRMVAQESGWQHKESAVDDSTEEVELSIRQKPTCPTHVS